MICAPITDTKARDFLVSLSEAEQIADCVEVRLDFLDHDQLDEVIGSLRARELMKPLILTYRPREQGGRKDLSLDERKEFWQSIDHGLKDRITYADLELDLVESFEGNGPISWDKVICSYHDFERTPEDLNVVFDRVIRTPAQVAKLATQVKRIDDCERILELATRAGTRPFVLLGMGPAGVATRVLSPARGALLTFGALRQGRESADGQPTVDELRNLYRVDRLTSASDIYGVIGFPIGHSRSPEIHNRAFARDHVDAVYIPFEVEDVAAFMNGIFRRWNIKGLSVTIPHKITIMRYLDWIDPVAESVGAVNTVVVRGDRLLGYNTDVAGAMKPLDSRVTLKGARVAVLGTGGSARAVIYGLKQRGAEVISFGRKTLNEFKGDVEIVINCTPLGMKGDNEGRSPVRDLSGVKLVYDLVYNPEETELLRIARTAGCETIGGLEMFYAQAEEQYRLWSGM
jgi:3-dehydroquinate dehydratase / shikimate dehydrogenase